MPLGGFQRHLVLHFFTQICKHFVGVVCIFECPAIYVQLNKFPCRCHARLLRHRVHIHNWPLAQLTHKLGLRAYLMEVGLKGAQKGVHFLLRSNNAHTHAWCMPVENCKDWGQENTISMHYGFTLSAV